MTVFPQTTYTEEDDAKITQSSHLDLVYINRRVLLSYKGQSTFFYR